MPTELKTSQQFFPHRIDLTKSHNVRGRKQHYRNIEKSGSPAGEKNFFVNRGDKMMGRGVISDNELSRLKKKDPIDGSGEKVVMNKGYTVTLPLNKLTGKK